MDRSEIAGAFPRHDPKRSARMLRFPFPLVLTAAFIFLGFLTHLWHPLWMLFLLIPVYYMYALSLRAATRRGRLALWPVVPVSVLLFLIAGFALHLWKFAWILFALDLVYYWYVITYGRGV